MELSEIYAEISAHMIEGIMIHEQLMNYYDFLCLDGYKMCHKYHYYSETFSHCDLNDYYVNHHNKLIPFSEINNPDIIPSNWFKHIRDDVDTATKQNAIKNGFITWINWEDDTKKLYEKMYKELMMIDEVASAIKIKELICDVDKELESAKKEYLNLEDIGYDFSVIIPEQKHLCNKYQKELKKIIY